MTEHRETLAALADVLIPAADGMPAASAVEVAGAGLDRVLASRPDLREPLARLLAAARGRHPTDAVAQLRSADPASFSVLTVVVTAAYYMDARVRTLLGYPGQQATPIDESEAFGDADQRLVDSVTRRGPIHRPT